MDKRLKLLLIFGIVIIILGVGLSLYVYNNERNSGTPKIIVEPKEYDAGEVSMTAGLVKHTYKIENSGSGDLEINSIKTSCMCTTAVLEVGDEKSPQFSMHNKNLLWTGKIPAKGEADLEVTFDPAFHESKGIGDVVRVVSFYTNDPDRKKVEVKLTASVIE
jgi:hypothetical protein